MECRERRDGSGTLKLIFGEGRDSDGDKVERSETLATFRRSGASRRWFVSWR